MNAHSSLPPLSPTSFSEGGKKISKKLGRESNFKKNLYWKPKRGRERKWAIAEKKTVEEGVRIRNFHGY